MSVSRSLFSSIAFFLALNSLLSAQNAYILTEFPIAAMPSNKKIWIKWTGPARFGIGPDSAIIYYDRQPGGAKLENYKFKIIPSSNGNNIFFPNVVPPMRGISFYPDSQPTMGYGVFYYMAALVVKTASGKDSAIYTSNELQMIIESPKPTKPLGPKDTITDLTPNFSWEANPGVPYYHVILSDEEIALDTVNDSLRLGGLSIVWQAITPKTNIFYGAPDPSGTITALPPPLSPAKTYSWIVLNNFGNHPAFTSTKFGLPQFFTIKGSQLKKPQNIEPRSGAVFNSSTDSIITFKWRNLDPNANTYKIYIYLSSNFSRIGAHLVVWENEVTAGTFDSIGYLSINPRTILTDNHYTWKVIAIDSKGAATSGDTTSFYFKAPSGRIKIFTREKIPVGSDTIISNVSAVQIQVEVLDGAMEAPLLFYTDQNGTLDRNRPTGTYRVKAIKNGFEPLSKTITVKEGQTTEHVFYLKRPNTTIFGQVLDESDIGINLATVIGISDQGDTSITTTDFLGSFILNCHEAKWTIWAEKKGFIKSNRRNISVHGGQNINLGILHLAANPITISGIVTNNKKEPLIGAQVKVLKNGVVVDEIPSTSQYGNFSFSLQPGTYTVVATKVGFSSKNITVELQSSKNLTIELNAGSALVVGYVMGRTWIDTSTIYAPITKATVMLIDTSTSDTFTAKCGATYGDFRISVPGNKTYLMQSSAKGYVPSGQSRYVSTIQGTTITINDTLKSLAMIKGTVIMSLTGDSIGNVKLSLIDSASANIVSSAYSQANGYFELNYITDGTLTLQAGKEGLSVDSIFPNNIVYINDGRVSIKNTNSISNFIVYMSQGDKTIKCLVNNNDNFDGKIKFLSPLHKILPLKDSLTNAGAGQYIIAVDAADTSFIDLSYHSFWVSDAELAHTEHILLPVTHNATAVLKPDDNDSVTLRINSIEILDSAKIFYKDFNAIVWNSLTISKPLTEYVFRFIPPKDGSTMDYYFVAYKGTDRWGYDKEIYSTYIKASEALTKLEIIPGSINTLVFPSNYEVKFYFQGYYGALFIADTLIDKEAINWYVFDHSGKLVVKGKGIEFSYRTPDGIISTPYTVRAEVDTNKKAVKNNVKSFVETKFIVSGSLLDSIIVKRIDAANPHPITTSISSRAEFIAEGLDKNKKPLDLSVKWKIYPPKAGSINAKGLFKPASNFAGLVEIIAEDGGLSGRYLNGLENGLRVNFNITQKSVYDTVNTYMGLKVVFPDSVVSKNSPGLLKISQPKLDNLNYTVCGKMNVISPVFDLHELNNVALNLKKDSILMLFDIPQVAQAKAKKNPNDFWIARWNDNQLYWDTLASSEVTDEGKMIKVKIGGFSRYAVITLSGELGGDFKISPNPFSPYVKPIKEFGPDAQYGTCLQFTADAEDAMINEMNLRIYNIIGDMVWHVSAKNIHKNKVVMRIWWDGRASNGPLVIRDSDMQESNDGKVISVAIKGEKMCRNGRYFAVLSLKDNNMKEKHYMQPIVLIK